jgi:hypothetical protein
MTYLVKRMMALCKKLLRRTLPDLRTESEAVMLIDVVAAVDPSLTWLGLQSADECCVFGWSKILFL